MFKLSLAGFKKVKLYVSKSFYRFNKVFKKMCKRGNTSVTLSKLLTEGFYLATEDNKSYNSYLISVSTVLIALSYLIINLKYFNLSLSNFSEDYDKNSSLRDKKYHVFTVFAGENWL